MTMHEESALDVLLFGTPGETLVDIKCFRGDRADVSPNDIRTEIHSGLMQFKLQPGLASDRAPAAGVQPRDMVALVKDLPVAA